MNMKTCLGNFFSTSLKNSVSTSNPDQNYGFLSWLQDINSSPSVSFRGKGGQLIIIDPTKNLVDYLASVNNNYSFGNVNNDMAQFLKE